MGSVFVIHSTTDSGTSPSKGRRLEQVAESTILRSVRSTSKGNCGVDLQERVISLVVRIVAFQAIDPGSNPG